MNSRERILKSINHEEPDRIPYDLAGSTWTGITNTAYQNLRRHLGLCPAEPDWSDVIQQIVVPSEEVLTELQVDTRGVFPLTSHNWDVYSKLKDAGDNFEYFDEWGFTHHFPKNGYWFSLVKHPMDAINFDSGGVVENYRCPDAGNKQRFDGMREKAIKFRNRDKIVMTKGLCAGLFEMHQRVRGMENAKLADFKIEFWDSLLDEIADVVDIAGEGDD